MMDLRNVRTGPAFATQIRMMREAGHSGAFLLVEGEDDAKFFAEFVEKRCHIQIGYGKLKVEAALAILDTENFRGVLAVVDADFEVLDGKTPAGVNLIWTDVHDVEMMMIRSQALERVLREFAEPTLIAGKDIRSQLLEVATPIGYWRWLSSRKGLSLVFEGLEFENFIHQKTLQLNEDELRRAIAIRTSKPRFYLDTHAAELESLRSCNPDPWHVCCGHDVVEVLAIGLRRVFSKVSGDSANKTKPAEIRGEQLEKSLRLAFHPVDFFSTDLATKILQWEARSGFVVLGKAA